MIKCIRDGQTFPDYYDYQEHCREFHPEIYDRMKAMQTLLLPKTQGKQEMPSRRKRKGKV